MVQLKEDVQLLNMVMIRRKDGCVLVLDKVKKEGWEGLTFPGGKVEPSESFDEAMRREAWEETGLHLIDLTLVGFVHWIHEESGLRQVGFLYTCTSFSGEVVPSREGGLRWIPFRDFLEMQPKSDSMDEMLRIYEGKACEVRIRIQDGKKGRVVFTSSDGSQLESDGRATRSKAVK